MRTYLIAEAGVNHNGSVEMACELIRVAKAAGADAIKFQTFSADKLVCRSAPKAEYQKKLTSAAESQFEMLKKLELDETSLRQLQQLCFDVGIDFLATPFDESSLDLLCDIGMQRIKISSGDLTNAPLLLRLAQRDLPVIVSTGMASLGDIEDALGVLAFGYIRRGTPERKSFQNAYNSAEGQELLCQRVVILHCTSEYPAPALEVNLRVIDTLRSAFGLNVGYSDHTEGIAVSVAAVARGAVMIEKHVTLDRNLPGPDHLASIEPTELHQLVLSIRAVEAALGSGIKIPSQSELKNRATARKSLVASKPVLAGEEFTRHNLTVKRPGVGVSPLEYWDYLGSRARKDFAEDELL